MKILIIVPRYNFTKKRNYDYSFPLGLGFISSVLKREGYSVDCLNLNHLAGTIQDLIRRKLDSEIFDYVLTGSNALLYSVVKNILNSVRMHPTNPRVILGGPLITTKPELMFNSLNPDVGVVGEGEETIIELISAMENKKDLDNIKGIIFKKNGETIQTPLRKAVENLDSLPYPDFEGLGFSEQLDNFHPNYIYQGNFFDNPRLYPVLASRSCPYQCTFCYHDTKYRSRSTKSILKELDIMVKKYKINTLLIYDECLAVDKKRLHDFCRGIRKLQKEISWPLVWNAQLRVDAVDKEILKEMKQSGCVSISYGFESYNQKVLDSMKKNLKKEKIDFALKETLNSKMAVLANFIFGDIAETVETSKETLDYWKENCKGQIGLGFIQPYPGSKIYEHCLKKGLIKDELDFIENKIVSGVGVWLNMTDNMSDLEIKNLKKEILESQAKYLIFSDHTIQKEKEIHFSVNAVCPFCNQLNNYKNCLIESRINYGFLMICRNCYHRFFIVSPLQRLGYKYYPFVRSIRDLQKKILDKLLKRSL